MGPRRVVRNAQERAGGPGVHRGAGRRVSSSLLRDAENAAAQRTFEEAAREITRLTEEAFLPEKHLTNATSVATMGLDTRNQLHIERVRGFASPIGLGGSWFGRWH